MKNPSTRELFTYWNDRRGDRLAPERADIEPGAIRRVLSDSFILAFDRAADHPFRLAGTKVCAFFGRELKDEPFVELWDQQDRPQIRDLLRIVAEEASGLVAGAVATAADGKTADLELLLLPLLHQEQTQMRLLGALSAINVPFWLGRHPVTSLTLGALRHLDPERKASRAARLTQGSRLFGLTVYKGGRS